MSEQEERWTIWVCKSSNQPYTCTCPGDEGCHDREVEVVPAARVQGLEGQRDALREQVKRVQAAARAEATSAQIHYEGRQAAESHLARLREILTKAERSDGFYTPEKH